MVLRGKYQRSVLKCPSSPVLTDQQGTVGSGEGGCQTTEDPTNHDHLNVRGDRYEDPAQSSEYTGGQYGPPGTVSSSAVSSQQGPGYLAQDFTAG